mgnify:FL=1|jgi:hypothetical protein
MYTRSKSFNIIRSVIKKSYKSKFNPYIHPKHDEVIMYTPITKHPYVVKKFKVNQYTSKFDPCNLSNK